MSPQEELEQVCLMYEQASERAMLEKVAWEAAQMSCASLMSSYQSMGKSHEEAQGMFETLMQDYSSRYTSALDEIARTSSELRQFLKKHPRLTLSSPRIKRRLGP